jgi:hypothetical protein
MGHTDVPPERRILSLLNHQPARLVNSLLVRYPRH